MTVPDAPRVLEEPPRSTGDLNQDFPVLLDWFYSTYQVIVSLIAYTTAIKDELVDANTSGVAALQEVSTTMVSGTATVSNTDTGSTVTFDVEQKDTDYVIMIQAKSITGSPLTASLVVSSKTYGTETFSFTVADAPGAGTSVTFDWQLIRVLDT